MYLLEHLQCCLLGTGKAKAGIYPAHPSLPGSWRPNSQHNSLRLGYQTCAISKLPKLLLSVLQLSPARADGLASGRAVSGLLAQHRCKKYAGMGAVELPQKAELFGLYFILVKRHQGVILRILFSLNWSLRERFIPSSRRVS